MGDCHQPRMAGQLKRSDTFHRRRKHDYERSDERSQRVKAALGSGAPELRIDCTPGRHVGSRKVSVSVKRTRRTKLEQTSTNLHSEELHDESCIVEH